MNQEEVEGIGYPARLTVRAFFLNMICDYKMYVSSLLILQRIHNPIVCPHHLKFHLNFILSHS